MTTEQLTALLVNTDVSAIITGLKAKVVADAPVTGQVGQVDAIDTYKKQFDVTGHGVNNTTQRPDKQIKGANESSKTVKVARISLGLQELIVERAVSFLFGSPVKIVCDPENDNQKAVLKALNWILKDNKIDSFNAEVALEMFRTTEVAEVWFPITKAEEHNDYGFPTKFKLRSMIFSPWDGNDLYPLFDETGDMIAFSRGYVVVEEGKEVSRFETYTANEHIVWKQAGTGWEEIERTAIPIGKIPVVYGRQKSVEWAAVQNLIERLETRLSNFADTNDYHGSPTVVVSGSITSMPDKGEAGKIIETDNNADVKYLEWNQAPDMTKLELETLIRFVYSLSQTPDISFEAVKGLGDISGVALRMLFLDAHLKVKKKQRVFDAYLERRVNIIKAYIGNFNTKFEKDVKAIDIESQIQPFIVDDQAGLIDRLMTANGNKPIISQKTAIGLSGMVDNVDDELKQIKEETDSANASDIFNPINAPMGGSIN